MAPAALSAGFAALAAWLLGRALARAVPLADREGARRYLKLKAVRTAGRLLIVVGVVAAGVVLAGGHPAGVAAGAVAGWLAATLPELRGPRGRNGDDGAIG